MESDKKKEPGLDTKQAIIEATSKLITEKGISDTSLADIAREVGISKGSLYYHYATKNDLIYDVAESHINLVSKELIKWISELDDNVPRGEIAWVVMEKIVSNNTIGRLHFYLISEALTTSESLKERFQEKYAEWRKSIQVGVQKIFNNDPERAMLMSKVTLAIIVGFTLQVMLGIEDIPQKEEIIEWMS